MPGRIRPTRTNPDGWIGEQLSVGANSERFFGGIRIDGESFHVGDAVFVRCELPNQVMKIDAMWEDANKERCFEGRWFYRPEDTSCGRLVGHDPRELFETVHVDENLVETIDGPCTIMEWDEYQRWLDEPAGDEDDDEDEATFVCRAAYHPGSGEFVPLTGASSLSEAGGRLGGAERHGGRHPVAAQQSSSHGKRAAGGPSSRAGEAEEHEEAPEDYAEVATAAPATKRRRRLGRFAEAAARLAPSAAPERMPCRETERKEVIGVLRSAVMEGALGGSLYLSGTPGTGKTATVHQALRALAADKTLPPFRTIFVNGMKLSSPYDVYSLLWEALTGQAAKPARALELLERRFAQPGPVGGKGIAVTTKGKRRSAQEKAVLVLDELDYLVTSKQSVIYNLFEWATRGSSHMVVVGISNTMDLPERLLPRVESRLNMRRVNFLPYSNVQLEAIIADRLGSLDAFGAQGATSDAVELCARKVASVSGDVRRALEICRLAAQVAEREEAAAHAAAAAPAPTAPAAHGQRGGITGGAGSLSSRPIGGRGAALAAAAAAAAAAAPAATRAPPPKPPPQYVQIEHIMEAIKLLKGSNLQVVVEAAPIQHKLLLACMVLLMQSSGRSEVEEADLRQRHRAICERLKCAELPELSVPEQNEAIARLCASRLLDNSTGVGALRLNVQSDDVKATVRGVPLLANLFPTPTR
jgi:Cdc6-like AAA superfamily ATPase